MRHGALLLLICACLSGQPVIRETRGLAVTRTTDADWIIIHLRNDYSSAATAWILQCERPQGGSRHAWMDHDLS